MEKEFLQHKLIKAIEGEDLRSIATFLRLGANPNRLDDRIGSPFHLAVATSNTKTASACIAIMLQAGANPNLPATDEDLTPVHVAAAWGRPQCLQQLISKGGDPSLTTIKGQNAMVLTDDIPDGRDRLQCKSILQRACYTTGSLQGRCKSCLYNNLSSNSTSLSSIRRKIYFDDDDNDINADDDVSGHVTDENNSCENGSSVTIKNLNQPEESVDRESQISLNCNFNDINLSNSMLKHCHINSTSTIASSPRDDTKLQDQLSSMRFDSAEEYSDDQDYESSTLYEVTKLNDSSWSHVFDVCKGKSKLEANESSYSLSSSFNSVSSLESNDSVDSYLAVSNKSNSCNSDNNNSCKFFSNYKYRSDESEDCNNSRDDNGIHVASGYTQESLSEYNNQSNTSANFMSVQDTEVSIQESNSKNLEMSEESGDETINFDMTSSSDVNDTADIVHNDEIWSDLVPNSNSTSLDSETIIYDWNEVCSRLSLSCCSLDGDKIEEQVNIPSELLSWSNSMIRQELSKYGEAPGPIIDSTRSVYLTYIVKLRQQNCCGTGITTTINKYPAELSSVLKDGIIANDTIKLEQQMIEEFQRPVPNYNWREGITKQSFSYLLLDPRITKNLPERAAAGTADEDLLTDFVKAIFYIGKGRKTRPFSHLLEALKANNTADKKYNKKVAQIHDIWSIRSGVISLHCYQSVIPVEAYTREAAMIDAIGVRNLTNERKGNYYGVAKTWTASKRRQLGAYLLYRAMKILINEGERHLYKEDIEKLLKR